MSGDSTANPFGPVPPGYLGELPDGAGGRLGQTCLALERAGLGSAQDDCSADSVPRQADGLCLGGCSADSYRGGCRADRLERDHFLPASRLDDSYPDGCSADSHWGDCRADRPECDHSLLAFHRDDLNRAGCSEAPGARLEHVRFRAG